MLRVFRLRALGALLIAFGLSCSAGAASNLGPSICGNLENHFGPFDYRVSDQARRNLVEHAHFTPRVESLQGGQTSMGPGGDMTYTLKVFPNHPRALMSMMRWVIQTNNDKPKGLLYSAPCWFDRAERFQPDDAVVKMIHGLYLLKKGQTKDSIAKLEEAQALDSSNPNVPYNLGLAYYRLKFYDKALKSAHEAYAKGFPLPGLRNLLQRSGHWRDPAPEGSDAPESSASNPSR